MKSEEILKTILTIIIEQSHSGVGFCYQPSPGVNLPNLMSKVTQALSFYFHQKERLLMST